MYLYHNLYTIEMTMPSTDYIFYLSWYLTVSLSIHVWLVTWKLRLRWRIPAVYTVVGSITVPMIVYLADLTVRWAQNLG